MDNKSVNKDLILREKLALERTKMANDRTFLSFVRTALYFSIAGISINEVLQLQYGLALEIFFWFMAGLIFTAGLIKYLQQKKRIVEHRKNIGNYQLQWETDDISQKENETF